MGIQDIIEGKKRWRAHLARVKALPREFQIVYKEIQRYFFKVGAADETLLPGIVDFFEEGVAAGKGVLELVGDDVAAFCDDVAKESRNHPARAQRDTATRPPSGTSSPSAAS